LESDTYTLKEAAERLGVSTRWARKLVDAGRLEAVRTGAQGRTRYSVSAEAVESFERERETS
jgi:excisionase family DNA binding protein